MFIEICPSPSTGRLCLTADPVLAEAAIIANAGGRVDADVIRSIIGLDALADAKGGVTSVIVAHHTGAQHLPRTLKRNAL